MPRKPFVLLLSYFIAGSFAQAQTGAVTPPPTVDQGVTPQSMDVGTPDQMGDADPLDVLEPKAQPDPLEPTVPQFTEIPDPESEIPKPEVTNEPPPPVEVAAPEAPPENAPEPVIPPEPAKKSSSPVVVNNDPDLRREERFHSIYKKYNEQPTSAEAWEKASGARKSEIYKVQKGDTLWDLSNTLFADSNYWPKIWSLNVNSIGNPHQIDPNMNIQFFPGTMSDAPTLGMVEGSAETMANAPQVASNAEAPIPAPKKRAPVLPVIPSSIPQYRSSKVNPPEVTVDVPSMERKIPAVREYLTYYVANDSPTTIGTIVETEMGMSTATDYQYVIVKMENPVQPNQALVALREMDKVKDLDGFLRRAHLIEVQGQLEIVEKVHESRDLYRAIVKKSLTPINVGSELIAGPLPKFDPSPTSLSTNVHAIIIGGEYASKRTQYQSNMIVFINAGSAQGVREGQSFPIYSNIRNRNPGSKAQLNDRRVGAVKVIRVSEGFSTAYVTNAQDDIAIGDHIGARNEGATANGWDIDGNTDIEKSTKSDLVPDSLEKEGSGLDL